MTFDRTVGDGYGYYMGELSRSDVWKIEFNIRNLLNFLESTWFISSPGRLVPRRIADPLVSKYSADGGDSTYIWIRSNGTGLLRVVSRSNISGYRAHLDSEYTALLSPPLHRRKTVSGGEGLYVADLTADQVRRVRNRR